MWKTATLGLVGFAMAAIGVTLLTFGVGAQEVAFDPRSEVASDVAAGPAFEMMVVTGTIQAAEEDFLGQATRVRIVSPEAGAFLIARDAKGRELESHVGAIVTVTAERTRDDEGNEILSVERYQVHEG